MLVLIAAAAFVKGTQEFQVRLDPGEWVEELMRAPPFDDE